MLSLGRCDAQICLNVGFALAGCEKPLCARGVHEPDIPSAGARATSARITALPCLVSSGSRPTIGCNGLGDRCLRPLTGNPADPSVFTRRVGLLSSHFSYNGLVNRCGESRLRTIGLSEPARYLGNLRRPRDLYQVPARVGGFHASSSYR